MENSDTLVIVIPAYNEELNIENCIYDWYAIIENYGGTGSRLVIVNDGSTDDTSEKLKKLSHFFPHLVQLNKSNGGHGSAVLYGYKYAIEQGIDWIFQTDSDGQTDPEEFQLFWEEKEQYDAIIGIRAVRGDGKSRKMIEDVVCVLLRLVFGIHVKDANAPFRLMKTKLVKKYIHKMPENFNIPNIMFTTYFIYFKENILFLPITFKPRNKGTNTINLKKIVTIQNP